MHVIISTHDPDRVAISRHSPAGPGNGRGRAVCQVDDTYGDGTNRRQVGAVTTAAQDGQSAAALHSDQHVRAGLGHGAHQRLGGEVPVQQHDHALAHAVEQARCIRRLAVGGRAEHRVDDRAGAAGHQHEQPQRRISRTTVVAAVLGERGQIRRAVGHRHGRAVDRADRQPFQARRQPLPHLPPAQPGEQTPGQQQIHTTTRDGRSRTRSCTLPVCVNASSTISNGTSRVSSPRWPGAKAPQQRQSHER